MAVDRRFGVPVPEMVTHGAFTHQVGEMCLECECCSARCEAVRVVLRCVHPSEDRYVKRFIGRDDTERVAIVCGACYGVIAVDSPGWERVRDQEWGR